MYIAYVHGSTSTTHSSITLCRWASSVALRFSAAADACCAQMSCSRYCSRVYVLHVVVIRVGAVTKWLLAGQAEEIGQQRSREDITAQVQKRTIVRAVPIWRCWVWTAETALSTA